MQTALTSQFVTSRGPYMKSLTLKTIENLIYVIRKQKVMLDSDLAELYGVSTKVLNQAVKRNLDRFPKDFMFQITKTERESLRSQFVTFKNAIARRKYLPYVFTEQEIAMLSTVLNSDKAIKVNIAIMRAFVKMRTMLQMDESLIDKIENLEKGSIEFKRGVDKVFRIVFERLETLEAETPVLPTKRKKIGLKS
jgi:hypothetical protein